MNGRSEQLRVLIVEDNPGDRRLLQLMLRESAAGRCQVEEAANLAGALERLTGNAIDLVLLDLNLPDSTGTDTVSKMRVAVPDLPIVVVTGAEDRETAVEALKRGAQDYLVKGKFDAHLLRRALARRLDSLPPKMGASSERGLRPMMEGELVVGWKCMGCGWWFRVENPARLRDYDGERKETVEKLFSAHSCALYKKSSV